jgi:hypothetical protein
LGTLNSQDTTAKGAADDRWIASRSIATDFLIESAPQRGEQLQSQLFWRKVYSSDVSAAGIQRTDPIHSNCYPGHEVTVCGELELVGTIHALLYTGLILMTHLSPAHRHEIPGIDSE